MAGTQDICGVGCPDSYFGQRRCHHRVRRVSDRTFKKNFYLIEVSLIYNVLVSGIQQSDSVICVFLFIFFFTMICHRRFDVVPCAIQLDFVFYLSYI